MSNGIFPSMHSSPGIIVDAVHRCLFVQHTHSLRYHIHIYFICIHVWLSAYKTIRRWGCVLFLNSLYAHVCMNGLIRLRTPSRTISRIRSLSLNSHAHRSGHICRMLNSQKRIRFETHWIGYQQIISKTIALFVCERKVFSCFYENWSF